MKQSNKCIYAFYSFDAAGQLARLANEKSNDSAISRFDYRYDKAGNRTSVVEVDGSRVTWSYDKTYQLTREERTSVGGGSASSGGCYSYDIAHSYDSTGNRLVKIDDGRRTTFVYDAANQLVTSRDDFGTTTYTYDASGNLQYQHEPDGGRSTYVWDAENRRTQAQVPFGIINRMTYRADGLRVKKIDARDETVFVWDGANLLLETAQSEVAFLTQAVYTWQPLAYGKLISQRRIGGASNFYHFDGLGSTDRLTNSAQTVTDAYCYAAYGELLGDSGDTVNPYLWIAQVGYFFDEGLEQYYVRARHYEPMLARWLSEDPLGFESSDVNLYMYVGGNPLLLTDPFGLDACKINIWAGDTLYSSAGLKNFYNSNIAKNGGGSICPSNFFGVIGCGAYAPGGKYSKLPVIPGEQQIPDFPSNDDFMFGAEMFAALKRALNTANALAEKLCKNRKCFKDDGKQERYACGDKYQRCDSVTVSVRYDKYITQLLRDGISPGKIPVPGLPNKESLDLLKKLESLMNNPKTNNCTQ